MAKGYRPSQSKNQGGQKADETIIDLSEVKHQAENFFEKNKIIIFSILGGLIVLVGGYYAYEYLYKEPKQAEALEQMYQAEIMFEKDSFDLALNNPGGGFAGFKEIAETYSAAPAGNLAKYYAGMCNLYLGNFEEAKTYFEDYKADGEMMNILKAGALGDTYAQLKDPASAISHYEKACKSDNEFLTAVYLKKLAILKEAQGDLAGALEAYKTLQKKYPNSPDAQGIEKYIIALE
ncbi:MAG: tetratricopeptide repeat protein [Bacteroidota bacterium]|nr:tetratricopeptide repeat protein [Bacteroidota bacterium]